MTPELQQALEQLRNAVENEGPRPDVHRRVVAETERVWPTLMRAVRRVLEESRG